MTNQQGAPEALRLGAVYAELPAPTASIGIDDAWHEPAMRDFADRTHSLRMQAAPKAAPVRACVCGEPQASGTVHRVDGPCYVAAPRQEAPKAAPGEPDPADIIAGALQISRGHAIEMMREALEATPQQEAHHLTQALTDPENQPNQYGAEFGMSGQQMHFKIGNQLFRLAYEPDDQQEFEFMKRMLIHAFSTFTPDVKAAPGEQNAVSAEWLEQAYREGWAACRDAETIGEEAEDWAFGNSTANSRMIDAQQAAPQQEAQEPATIDQKTMELAESVGLIGPASRVGDLHAAIQRFHDLICVNATIKAAVMAADVIRGVATPARDYPPLPMQFACSGMFPVYSADQMRAYVDADRAAYAPASSQPAPVVDKCTKQQLTTEVLRRMQQQEDGHNKNPFRSLLDRLMRNEGGYSTIEIGQLKYALDGFYGAARAQAADSVLEDAAFEAVRKKLCALPRFSFLSDGFGVRRVPDKSGSWIAFDAAHELFDPVAVDAALAAQGGKV